VRRTTLVVGEGLAEATFLKHLKSLYLVRGQASLTVKNAKGKGGRQVLEFTLRQRRAADYDRMATLLDTDADWDDAQRARARKEKVTVFESSPCIEALLLRVAGHSVPPTSTLCKQAFAQRFGAPAHRQEVYDRHFTVGVLNEAKDRVPLLDALVKYLRS
jgi:hypothetical protein